MSRKHEMACIVDLRIVLTENRGADFVELVNRAIHEALKRRVPAHTAAGPQVVHGVEGFEQDCPVDLPSGATAILKWTGLELSPELVLQ